MESSEFCYPSGKRVALYNVIDKSVLSFLNKVTEPWKEDEDLKLFFNILQGSNYNQDRLQFNLQIGSLRLMQPGWENAEVKPFYSEFLFSAVIAGRAFYLSAFVLNNELGTKHEFEYVFDLKRNIESLKGVSPALSNEIALLIKLNREIRVNSQVTATV
jgi:hypothetical protein